MTSTFPRRALVSVSDKMGLGSFVQELVDLGFEIVSTGGTRRFLEKNEIPVTDVSAYTGFPEILDGRVKTLHPKVHGGILARTDRDEDLAALQQHEITPFELVVCNLYPFERTVARPDVTRDEAIEQIDIGGPCMIRAAAKNHAHVGVVTSPSQYPEVLDALHAGSLSGEFRRQLAAAAFERTARYDRAIADYFASLSPDREQTAPAFPRMIDLTLRLKSSLRYGENPHQRGAFYVEPQAGPGSLAAAEQLHGKELSYNNLLDLDAALRLVREFSDPAAAVIKHNNPCGCGIGATLAEAFEKGYGGDPVSAFGSILAFNRVVDGATAETLCEPNRFIEAVIAPGYEDEAFKLLTTRPAWKKNVRLMRCALTSIDESDESGRSRSTDENPWDPNRLDYRRVTGGLLVQDRDDRPDSTGEWKTVTEGQPTAEGRRDLDFAWRVCKHVKSNAIVFAKDGMLVGVGAGQMSRLDSVFLAARKAGDRSQGAVLASDAFFPFRDGIDEAARAGIAAVIQPGGSRRDDEVIAACNEYNLPMLFTGRRHFRH